MSASTLVIGLDGADLDVVSAMGPTALPVLHRLMGRGAWARLRSVTPPATLPNWTTFLTGVDPGEHGVFDFTVRRGRHVEFAAGTVREAATFALRLDRLGLSCAVIGFPATWPPERLANGVFISGWDSPVAFEADRSFVWPPSLFDEIRQRFGPIRWGDVDELSSAAGWHETLPRQLCARVERRTELAAWLLDQRSWDVFAVYFGESDTAAHHLWAHHDPGSPRHPHARAPLGGLASDGLRRVYRALDEAVGVLIARAGEETEITILSDHGSGGASDKVLYLNRALAEAGLLRFKPGAIGAPLITLLKRGALGAISPRFRQRLFDAAGRALPGRLESEARFGAIDFSATRAFSDELNYFPAIHLNLRGREPSGLVAAGDVRNIQRELEGLARDLRDPWTGERIISAVVARGDLYRGPFVARAPDFILELALDRGYSWNLMPSASAPPGAGPIRRLDPSEHLGRKGRSLPGSHRPRGLYVAAGPRVRAAGEIDARIADATSTLLSRMGIRPGPELAGRVLREALVRIETPRTLPVLERPRASRDTADLSRTEARLRALGYVD